MTRLERIGKTHIVLVNERFNEWVPNPRILAALRAKRAKKAKKAKKKPWQFPS